MGLGPSVILERLWGLFVLLPVGLIFLLAVFGNVVALGDEGLIIAKLFSFLPFVLIGIVGLAAELTKRRVFVSPVEAQPSIVPKV